MTKTQAASFDGFYVSNYQSTFEMVGCNFQISRAWRRTSSFDAKPEFSTTIYGSTTGDEVCLLGTNRHSTLFDIVISSDCHTEQVWTRLKDMELFLNALTGERRRIRDLQHERFDQAPPTASLFDPSDWRIELKIPLPVLDQLSADLIANCVDTVSIQIEWPFGFRDKLTHAWGFFEGSMLRGYVSRLTWSPPAERLNPSPKNMGGPDVAGHRPRSRWDGCKLFTPRADLTTYQRPVAPSP